MARTSVTSQGWRRINRGRITGRMTIDDDILTTPVGFIEGILGLPLYEWQDNAVMPLERAGYGLPLVQISVLAPNEGGKSSRIVAGSAMYWLARWEKGKVGITTRDLKQLKEQIIPALEAQVSKFEGWTSVQSPYYKITTPTGGSIIAFTTDNADRVEGLHGAPDAPLLWIVDEAKSVEKKIFDGIDRCGYQGLIYCSSGGLKMGTFYDSHYGETATMFVRVRAGLTDCPHIAKEKIERIIRKHGLDAPFTRSCLYGEFMDQSEDDEYCVELKSINNCYLNPPKHRPGIKAGFWDWGGATAEHVLAVRNGNKYEIAAAFVESNKDAAAGRAIAEMRKAGFKPDDAPVRLRCDASDKEIWKKLSNAGWNLSRQNFGAPPRLKKEYKSWGAEAWLEGALKISQCEVILPEDDEVFKTQAVSRKKGYTNDGRLEVEDKMEMLARGAVSPDRPDAVFGAMAIPEPFEQTKGPISVTGWRDHIDRQDNSELLTSIGANVGY